MNRNYAIKLFTNSISQLFPRMYSPLRLWYLYTACIDSKHLLNLNQIRISRLSLDLLRVISHFDVFFYAC